MAFIEYPVTPAEEAAPAAVRRDLHNLSFPRGSHRSRRETRAARSAGVGWAAGVVGPYAPLGDMSSALDADADSPAAYARRRKQLGVRVVWPGGGQMTVRKGEAEPKYDMTLLRPGVVVGPCRIDKHTFAYYCVDKPASKVLTVSLEALGGDPDLYVCNECRTPSFEQHTWKATAMGGDVLHIYPTDPFATPGRYYISVYATIQNTTYNVHVALENPVVTLPDEVKDARSTSFKQVCEEVRAGQQRSAAVRAGASLLDQIDAQIVSLGHEPIIVRAAAEPVMRQIDEIRKQEIERSRSPSPERRARRDSPPRRGDASESASAFDAGSRPSTSGRHTPAQRHSSRHLEMASRPSTAAPRSSANPPSTVAGSGSSNPRGSEGASRPSTGMRKSCSLSALRPSARPGSALIDTIRGLNLERVQAAAQGGVAAHARGAAAATAAAPEAVQPITASPDGAQILRIVTPPASPTLEQQLWPPTGEWPQATSQVAAAAAPPKGGAGRPLVRASSSGCLVSTGMRTIASAPMVITPHRSRAKSLGRRSFALPVGGATGEDEDRDGWLSAQPLPEKPAPPTGAAAHRALQFDWQAPAGVLWSALPRDTGMMLVRSQYAEAKIKLDKRLTEQLEAAAARRPLEYHWRMQVMARIEAESTLFGSQGLRGGTRAIEAEYVGAALAGTAPAGEWGAGSRDERDGKGGGPSRRLEVSASVPNLHTSQIHSQRVEQYLSDARSKRRDGGKAKLNAVALLERRLKPPPLDADSTAVFTSPKIQRRGSKTKLALKVEPKAKLKREPSVLRNLKLEASSAHKTLPEQLADAMLISGDSIIDIFRSWDDNASGSIDKAEFTQVIRKLGFRGPQHDIECAFDMFDQDGSGFLGYDELAKLLRMRTPAVGHA
jgi:hypothetical protein